MAVGLPQLRPHRHVTTSRQLEVSGGEQQVRFELRIWVNLWDICDGMFGEDFLG